MGAGYDHEQDAWHHVLPPSTFVDAGHTVTIPVHVPHGSDVEVDVSQGQDSIDILDQVEDNSPPRDVSGVLTGRARFAIPELPAGRYTLRALVSTGIEATSELIVGAPTPVEAEPDACAAAEETNGAVATAPAAEASEVTEAAANPPAEEHEELSESADEGPEPDRAGPDAAEPAAAGPDEPSTAEFMDFDENMDAEELLDAEEALDRTHPSDPLDGLGREEYHGRNWGLETALYALRSVSSWGIGDLADLADLATVAASVDADYLLLDAFTTSVPEAVANLGLDVGVVGSYGLVLNPVHIRPEDIREVAYLPTSQRTMLEWGSEAVRVGNTDPAAIDIDQIAEAKRAALETIFAAPRSPKREAEYARFLRHAGADLALYVHAAVAAETQSPQGSFSTLNEDSNAGSLLRRDLADRIEFHLWMQWVAHDQLGEAAYAADNAGLRLGLVLRAPVTASRGYLRALASYAGGLLLTGVPLETSGESEPGVLAAALEASAEVGIPVFVQGVDSGAAVAGSTTRGGIPTTTLWREVDGTTPRDLAAFPAGMVSVTTLADPPTATLLAGEYLDLFDRLGVLDAPVEDLRRRDRIRRDRVLDRLRGAGLLEANATERPTIEALYTQLAATPARLITVALTDATGHRPPLVAGGDYPDWRIPFLDAAGGVVLLEGLASNTRFTSLVGAIDRALRAIPGPAIPGAAVPGAARRGEPDANRV